MEHLHRTRGRNFRRTAAGGEHQLPAGHAVCAAGELFLYLLPAPDDPAAVRPAGRQQHHYSPAQRAAFTQRQRHCQCGNAERQAVSVPVHAGCQDRGVL